MGGKRQTGSVSTEQGFPTPCSVSSVLCTTEEFLSDYTSSFIFRKAKFFLNTHFVAKRLTKSGNHTIIGLFRYLQGTRSIYLSFYNTRLYNDV